MLEAVVAKVLDECAGLGIEEDGTASEEVAGRRDDVVLYPPTHARCLAVCQIFLSTCAIESFPDSGDESSECNWIEGTICCNNKARNRPTIIPIARDRVATAMT